MSFARQPFVPTPSQLYGRLFVRVQMEGLHPGNDNFVDDIPKESPLVVMRRFRAADPRTRAALLRFLEENFNFPPRVRTPPIPADRTVTAHIARLWPLLTRPATVPPAYSSLLYVPKPYVVPGGAFQEFYYWDSYFTMLGLIPDGHMALARDLVADFSYLIRTYGHIPNGARTFYLSRSQPPVYYLMVGLLDRRDPAAAWAAHLPDLEREYAYWMRGARGLRPGEARRNAVAMPDGAILNRYWDARDTPRDEGYRNDVLTARASGRRPRRVYRDIRAAAESGWDFSSRWLEDRRHLATIRTTAIVPVDLNSLLYGMEEAIARGCAAAQELDCERAFEARARRRRAAMDRYLWDASAGYFVDYDWRAGKRRDGLSAATLYPLFVGLATRQQAARIAAVVQARLLEPGGIVTTTIDTGQQWDAPNGWAPLQWIAVRGLARYGHRDLARLIACRWVATVRRVYANTGMIFEKYNVERQLPGGGGEYPVQDGFGWTNGVTRGLLQHYPEMRSVAAGRYNRGAACAPATRLPRRPPPSATGGCSSPCGASSRAGASCPPTRCPSSSTSTGRSPAA
jgi:alpha,alpha-trehalase